MSTLGKRKRNGSKAAVQEADRESSPEIDAQSVFRKFFESRFESIEMPDEHDLDVSQDLSDSESESSFEGFSEDGVKVEIVDYGARSVPASDILSELTPAKTFMTAKPPSLQSQQTPQTKGKQSSKATEPDPNSTEELNLKHDLALQRLLQESHLLDSNLQLAPSQSRAATLLRLKALGATSGATDTAGQMPMRHRMGIERKRTTREETRRAEAKENGIILERKTGQGGRGAERESDNIRSGKIATKKRRNGSSGGVGAPAVGKFRRGMLSLSRRDVAEINGPPDRGRFGKKGRPRR